MLEKKDQVVEKFYNHARIKISKLQQSINQKAWIGEEKGDPKNKTIDLEEKKNNPRDIDQSRLHSYGL